MTRIQVGAIGIGFLVEAEDSGGSATVFECYVPAGSKVLVPHSHDAFEETIYGLQGTCSWTVDGERHEVAAGDAICVRRGQIHGFANETDADVKFLALATPGVFGPSYFQDLADVIASAAGGPPDPGKFAEVMLRHGLTPAPPVAA